MYDLVIIGAGMAGLTSAIYAARAGLNFVVLEQDGWGGGQIVSAHRVENYPGVPDTAGADLGDIVKAQAESLGAQIELGIVEKVTDQKEYKEIILDDGSVIQSKAVIAATGANPRKLGVPGEDRLLGSGVSYCALCDGSFFADRDVFVVGGGDTAVEDSIYLAGICKSVTQVHRRKVFRAPKTRIDKLRELPNVTIRCDQTLHAIIGEGHVSGVELNEVPLPVSEERSGGKLPSVSDASVKDSDTRKRYDADAVFIAVGTEPVTSYLRELPLAFENGYVVAGEDCRTNVDGFFVAGDIRRKPLRQAVTAACDGANAAMGVVEYLQK